MVLGRWMLQTLSPYLTPPPPILMQAQLVKIKKKEMMTLPYTIMRMSNIFIRFFIFSYKIYLEVE